MLYRQLSRLDEAEHEAERGIAALIPGGNSRTVMESGVTENELLVAMHLRALGGVWRLRGKFDMAARAHKIALHMFECIYGTNHTDFYRSLDSLARVQREWGDLSEALVSFKRAHRIVGMQFEAGHAHSGTVAVNMALVQMELGEYKSALIQANRGLAIYKRAYAEPEDNTRLKNESTVWALFVHADALVACGQSEQALIDHETVLRWRLKAFQHAHAHHASSYYAVAEALLTLGLHDARDRAISNHQIAHAIRLKVFGDEPNYWVAVSEARLGELLGDRLMLSRAHDFFSVCLKPGHWRAVRANKALLILHANANGSAD